MKILVVEDNYEGRKELVTQLEKWGHQVIEATNGKEGARLYFEESPYLTITDMQMPLLNGDKMIKEILKRRPGARFIGVSASHMWDLPIGVPLLLKPYDFDHLKEFIEAM